MTETTDAQTTQSTIQTSEVLERFAPTHAPGTTPVPWLATDPDLTPNNILLVGRLYRDPDASVEGHTLLTDVQVPEGFNGWWHRLELRSGYESLQRAIYVRAGSEWNPDWVNQMGRRGAFHTTIDLDAVERAVQMLREECGEQLLLVWNCPTTHRVTRRRNVRVTRGGRVVWAG